MAVDAGSVFVRLSGLFDRKGFDDFDRNVVKAQKVKDIKARLGGDFDSRDFDAYERRLKEAASERTCEVRSRRRSAPTMTAARSTPITARRSGSRRPTTT
jgi:hypothetical protein